MIYYKWNTICHGIDDLKRLNGRSRIEGSYKVNNQVNFKPFILLPEPGALTLLWALNKYLEAMKHNISIGMRLKMRFKGEEAPDNEMCQLCVVVYHL
jgi:hypothetical protein